LRQRLGLPQGKTIVVFTGRLVSWKGLPLLIKVWERIHHNHPHAFLLLVGSGGTDIYNCEDELKEFVRSNYLQDSVGLTGDVRNVHEYLQASDIFVFPTEKDAFGISLIEAMACGLPVVAARTGAIKEIVTPGQDGLMVEPGDFQQLYAALDKLLDDNSLAMSLGAAARRTAMERYSDEVIIEKYIEVFQSFSASAQHAVANA
jgi:mannosyltransferase